MNMQRHDELIDQWNSESAPTQSTPPAAGQAAQIRMSPLSQDLTHFFASDHFAVKKAAYMEDSHAANMERIKKLEEALEVMLDADEAISENRGLKSDQAMQRIAAMDSARSALARS